jgi:hypothetical protein
VDELLNCMEKIIEITNQEYEKKITSPSNQAIYVLKQN